MRALKATAWGGFAVAIGVLAALLWTPLEETGERSPARPPFRTDPGSERVSAPPDASAVARLQAALDDPEALPEAVRQAGTRGNSRAVPLLVEVYERDPDVALKADILRSLELIAGRDAVGALAGMYRNDAAYRDQVAVRLSRIADRKAAPALVQVIEEEGRRGPLAAAALRSLGRARLREHAALCVEIARDGDDEDTRAAAAGALGLIADPEAVAVLGGLLGEASVVLRRAAIRGLGRIRSARALELLEEFRARHPGRPELDLVEQAIDAQRGEPRSPLR